MQENNYTNDNTNDNGTKKMVIKSGITLVIRSNYELNTKELSGLLQHNNLQNGKHFLVFNTNFYFPINNDGRNTIFPIYG